MSAALTGKESRLIVASLRACAVRPIRRTGNDTGVLSARIVVVVVMRVTGRTLHRLVNYRQLKQAACCSLRTCRAATRGRLTTARRSQMYQLRQGI